MTARTQTARFTRWVVPGMAVVLLVACGPREPVSEADRLARGRELVRQMSARLAAADAISVTTTEVRDVVRGSDRKETVTQSGLYTVRRPDRFHVRITDGLGLETWYNGKTLTVAAHPEKVFAQAPMPDTIDRTLDALAERYDMALPMGDLFYASAEGALLSDTTTGGYAGTETVDGTPCVHLAFKDVGVEWDLWLPEEGDPLPKRLRVVQTHRTGQPVADLTFGAWNLAASVTDATFVPKVPPDFEGIALVQRAAAIKEAPVAPATGK